MCLVTRYFFSRILANRYFLSRILANRYFLSRILVNRYFFSRILVNRYFLSRIFGESLFRLWFGWVRVGLALKLVLGLKQMVWVFTNLAYRVVRFGDRFGNIMICEQQKISLEQIMCATGTGPIGYPGTGFTLYMLSRDGIHQNY